MMPFCGGAISLSYNPPVTSKRGGRWIIVFCSYAACVGAVYRDVAAHLGTYIIAGDRVGAVFVWDLWWRKTAAFGSAFTTDLMFPRGVPVLPHSPLVLGLGRAMRTFFDPYVTHNVLHLAAYPASGLAMFALAHEVTRDSRSSFLAGFLFMFSHYALTQHTLGHLGESAVFFLPVAVLGFLRLLSGPGPASALLFSAGSVGACLSTPYLAFAWLGVGFPLLAALNWRRVRAASRVRAFRLGLSAGLAAAVLAGAAAYRPLFVLGRELIGGTESYSISLLSFFDFPSWHPAAWVQVLRRTTSGMMERGFQRASSENLMSFFGLSAAALLALGLRRENSSGWKPWAGLFVGAAILSLGPLLQVSYRDTAIALPYGAFKALPFLSLLREPARLIVLSALALAVLSAIAFKEASRRLPGAWAKTGLLVLLLAGYSWEMGLSAVGGAFVALNRTGAHAALARDDSPGAVLELPGAVFNRGDVTVNVQEYMLYQPLHRRPLVLGRPPRHTRDSLVFLESTDFVYELTHPHVLPALYASPALRPRLESLRRNARAILEKNGIRYVLFHSRDAFFPEAEKSGTLRLLTDALGVPSATDQDGIMLFKVF